MSGGSGGSVARAPVERFPALAALGWLVHGFVGRVPDVEVAADKEEVLRRLEGRHREAVREAGADGRAFVWGEQVHGAEVAAVGSGTPSPVPGVDALVTNDPGVCLGVHVADCCPVYIVDTRRRAVGLAHAGRAGTARGVVPAAFAAMERAFGSRPADLLVQLGPCIRPPHYEEDFAGAIVAQCRAAGVGAVHDCGANTGADTARYYSYRIEKGRTGRMLAFVAVR